MREWLNMDPNVHVDRRNIFDVLFQLYWIITLVAVNTNLVHGDFHIEQVLINRLPCECTRRYIVYNTEKKFVFSYSSNWSVCVVDWALSASFIPYTRSRSASSSSRRTKANPIGSFPFPNSTYIFAIIDDAIRANPKAYGTLGPFMEMNYGLTFFRLAMFDVLDPSRSFSHQLYPTEDLTTFKFGMYLDWAVRSAPPLVPEPFPKPPSRRGRPRIYASEAERKRAYRQRKKIVHAVDPPASSDDSSSESPSEASYPQRAVLIDLFGLIYDTPYIVIQKSMICVSLGVFAIQNVPSGTRLTEYCGQIISWEDIKGLDEWQKTHLRALSKMHTAIDGIRLPQVFMGVGSFVNSSDGTPFAPNAKFSIDDVSNRAYITSIRDITQGEEILVDYNYDWKEMELEKDPPKAPTKKRARNADVAAESPRKRYKKDNS